MNCRSDNRLSSSTTSASVLIYCPPHRTIYNCYCLSTHTKSLKRQFNSNNHLLWSRGMRWQGCQDFIVLSSRKIRWLWRSYLDFGLKEKQFFLNMKVGSFFYLRRSRSGFVLISFLKSRVVNTLKFHRLEFIYGGYKRPFVSHLDNGGFTNYDSFHLSVCNFGVISLAFVSLYFLIAFSIKAVYCY